MSAVATLPPARRSDLLIREVGPGQYVVKQSAEGSYFRIGPVEHFLLLALDGTRTAEEICTSFEERFGEPLSLEELDEFVELMRKRDLIASPGRNGDASADDEEEDGDDDMDTSRSRQSWLYFRKSLFNPDRMLTAAEPPLRWIWTRGFVLAAVAAMLAALFITIEHRRDWISSFPETFRWSTVVAVWVAIIGVTMLHEFAHGLTCKHFGGEVREIGVLMIFFTPCLYCNVSDAWLMPKKSHRLWITLAGSFCDLCVWALAVFAWRVTNPVSLVNHLAWVLASVCGGRILINLNPFVKMDGYYLMTDILGLPNLRSQARSHLMGHVRWLLWGARRPERRERGLALLLYGLVIWVFAIVFLDLILLNVFQVVASHSGMVGVAFTALLVTVAFRRVFKGFFSTEAARMLTQRPKRTLCWALVILGVPAALFAIHTQSTSNGEFEIRPGTRVEVHSPIAGFVRKVHVEEGDRVECGQPIVTLEVPDLSSFIIRKEAEIRETNAALTRLRAGTRPEVLEEQRQRVRRAEEWKALAEQDLRQANVALQQDLLKFDLEFKQSAMEIEFARTSVSRAEFLYRQGAIAGEQLRAERKKLALLESQLGQSQARKTAREADGVRSAAAELARRDKELAEVRAAQSLLEAGSRPEDVEAEKAKLARLEEELKFLREQESQLVIVAPSAGIVATPRMIEKIGQLADKGALVCLLDDPRTVQVEIQIAEDDVPGVAAQQSVSLKSRALPFDNFQATVERIAPNASLDVGKKQNMVRVYCSVDNNDGRLKSGMTGFARISRGERSLGQILLNRGLKMIRTEFWW